MTPHHPFLSKSFKLFGLVLAGLVLLTGGISIIRSTVAQGTDFFVFWNAARLSLNGEPLYSMIRDGSMVFKYPPWLLSFFLPFGFLSLETSKWIWGITEVTSLALVVRWIHIKLQVRWFVWFLSLLLFWGLWIVHALDGQLSLHMLAIALWGWSRTPPYNGLKFFGLFTGLSAKIFTVFPLGGLVWSKKTVLASVKIGLLWIILSTPALLNQPDLSPVSLLVDWKEAATSAGKFPGGELVRGRRNPGLPGYSLYLLGVPAENSFADVAASVFFIILFGVGWRCISKNFSTESQWLGWIAFTPVVHPLPWWHLFVFTFPLATYVLDRSFKERNRIAILCSVVGIFLIGLSTEKLWGKWGVFLETNASKSWGTLLCLSSLMILERKRFH